MDPFALIAQSMGGAWTSGVNAYATCAALGLLGRYGGIELGGNLTVLESWWVIVPALVMYVAEFFADKAPWLDSTWDAAHTFVRIPAGALLAASVYSESGAAVQVAALLAGGALAGAAHELDRIDRRGFRSDRRNPVCRESSRLFRRASRCDRGRRSDSTSPHVA